MPTPSLPSRRAALAALAASALVAGCASTRRQELATPVVPRGTLSMDDRTLAMQAAGAGLYQIEAGKLAASRAGDAGVRDFGQLLVRQLGASNSELATVLAAHGLALPSRLPPQFDARLAALAAAPAEGFDRRFVQVAGLQDQRSQVALFEQARLTVQDPVLRNWFDRMLPVLRQRLQLAQTLAGMPG